ncbi:putative integral membrane protein [Acanthocheilonema viteae]
MLQFLPKHIGRFALKIYTFFLFRTFFVHGIFLRFFKQMYLWFTITMPITTTFITSFTGSITITTMLLSCAIRKSKRLQKSRHLPEFVDPNAKEADTYYGMRSTIAFPVKASKIKRDDLNAPQAKTDNESNLRTEEKDVRDRRVQLGSTLVQKECMPVGFVMQYFFQVRISFSDLHHLESH